MIFLDENIIVPERERLRAMRIHCRHVGHDVGRQGMKDINEVIPLLHQFRRPTFFTRDRDFYHPSLLHTGYCLIHLDVAFDEVADYLRRFLRHTGFRTQSQRMGKIVRVHYSGINYWQRDLSGERTFNW